MTLSKQIARHLREVYFGGNWTEVDLTNTLAGVTWQQAVTKVHDLNTIAALVFHINYYVNRVLPVFQGRPLQESDTNNFDHQPITSEDDWQKLVTKAFTEAEWFAVQIEALNEKKIFEIFEDPKHGNYFRNMVGIIEHTYYHLGQILLIKKILNETKPAN